MQTTDKQAVIRAMQKYNNGAGVIVASEFARFLGVGPQKAKEKLKSLPAFEGKYYLLADVADYWLKELKVE